MLSTQQRYYYCCCRYFFFEIFPSSIFHNYNKNTREKRTQKKELNANAVDLATLENYVGKLTQDSIMHTLTYLRNGGDAPEVIRSLLFEMNSHKQMWDRNGNRAHKQFFSAVLKSGRMDELFNVPLVYFLH